MTEDNFKYNYWRYVPDSTTIIKTCNKKDNYAVKVDTSEDIPLSLYNFSQAYFESAHIIATRMLDKMQIDELDSYVFPLFYLYRHSLELLLKSICFTFILDKSQRQSFLTDKFHNLKSIYEYILQNTTFPRDDKEHQWLVSYFENVSRADEASDSFRYPFHILVTKDKFGKRQFEIRRVFQKQTNLNLISEADKFEAAYEILNAWYLDICEPTILHNASEYTECDNTFLDEGGYYYSQSVVGYHNDFYAYCNGYKECASYLLDYLTKNCDQKVDLHYSHMWYPMSYLYRNTIELSLKFILFQYSPQSWQTKCEVSYDNKHKLCQLLKNIKKITFKYYEIEEIDEYIKNLTRYCDLLHKFDSDSGKFRYPIDKFCKPYFSKVRYYSFVEVGIFLKSLASAIDGISGEIEYRKEIIDSLRSEYSDY